MNLDKMRMLTNKMKKLKGGMQNAYTNRVNHLFHEAATDIEHGNPKSAFNKFMEAATQEKNPIAMYNVALAYYNGTGVDKDIIESVKWFTNAANAGDSEAMYNVAMAYKNGVGVEQNWEQCFQWALKAAESENVLGMFVTSVCYGEGLGVKSDTARSFAWLKKAIKTDEATIRNVLGKKIRHLLCQLGWQYLYGEGVLQNSKEGVMWLTKAADRYNDYLSMRLLGLVYGKGEIPDIPINIDNALKYFEKIAALGFPNREYAAEDVHNLWILCKKKVKMAKNPKEVEHYKSLQLKWLNKAAKLGDEEAKKELSHIPKKNRISSYVLQKRKEKATAGDIMAMINLGCYYLTEDDYDTAAYWLERAREDYRETGQRLAAYVYSIMYEEGLCVTLDSEQSAKFRETARKHNIQYMDIGFIYESLGNLSKAKYYYEKELIKRKYMKKIDNDIYVDTGMLYTLHLFHWPNEDGSVLFKNFIDNLHDADWAKNNWRLIPANKRLTVDGSNVLMRDPWSKSNTWKKSSDCFITTAVFCSFGKSDDCYELTKFRAFRDGWLRQQSDGESLIARYYQTAPSIVKHINRLPNAKEIYRGIWDKYLQPCLNYLETAKYQRCKQIYVQMVESLEKLYG